MNKEESLHQKSWRGLDPLNCLFYESAEVPAEFKLYIFRLFFKDRTLKSYTVYAMISDINITIKRKLALLQWEKNVFKKREFLCLIYYLLVLD